MVLRHIGLDCHQPALVASLPLYPEEHIDVGDPYLQPRIQRRGVAVKLRYTLPALVAMTAGKPLVPAFHQR